MCEGRAPIVPKAARLSEGPSLHWDQHWTFAVVIFQCFSCTFTNVTKFEPTLCTACDKYHTTTTVLKDACFASNSGLNQSIENVDAASVTSRAAVRLFTCQLTPDRGSCTPA